MRRRQFLAVAALAPFSGLMLARRLLIAAGGGGFPVPPGPSPLSAFEVTPAPAGGHTFFGGPRGLTVDGYTYLGYVFGAGGSVGTVTVSVWNNATAVIERVVQLHATFETDDHVNPSLLVRPDGKLQAFYAHHSPLSTTMYTQVSVNTIAADPTLSGGWAGETSLDAQLGADSYDYPQPMYLSSESLIYMFWRSIPSGNDYDLWFSTSADGDTWATGTRLYHNSTKTNRAYWQIISNDVDTIHIGITDGSPNTDTTHIGHLLYDGAWRASDGTTIGSPPFDFADTTPVHISSNSWVWDIALDPSSGRPRILFATYPTEFSDHRYNLAAWDGATWSSNELCAAGGGIDATGVYSGGVCFDHEDPRLIFASRVISGQWEMCRYYTENLGASASLDQITSGSSVKNIRPVVPRGRDNDLAVYWMRGTYTGFTSWNTGLEGAA